MYPKLHQKCCRLCLGTTKKQLEICAIPELLEMLKTLYKLELNPSDGCSSRICVDCYYEAKVFCNWQRVHRKLKQQLETNQAIFEKELNRQEAVPGNVPSSAGKVEVEILCKICGTKWETMKLLKKHLHAQHQIPRNFLKSVQQVAKEKEPVRCESCSVVFSEDRTLFYHKITSHKRVPEQKLAPEKQPPRRVFRSRSTRALENYPGEMEPSARTTRRSKSIASPVELLPIPSQSKARRTRSKSQDLEKMLAKAAMSMSREKQEKAVKITTKNVKERVSKKDLGEPTPQGKSDAPRKPPRMRSLSVWKDDEKRQLRKRALSTMGL